MIHPSDRSIVSRRILLTGVATMPTLFVGAGSSAAQTAAASTAVKEVQAALRNASGTKLVMLGTGAGPNPMVPGRNPGHIEQAAESLTTLNRLARRI
jgi:hypothetical protein